VWGSTLHQGACRARAGKASAMKENKNWWGKDTRACTHARTHAHTHTRTHTRTHARIEFDEFPESDKEEWLEGIRSAEEEQEQEQQNSMDTQRSGSDRVFLRNTFRVAGS
jgi:hypothetical protein